MASNADWKNPHIDSTNLSSPKKGRNDDQGHDRKDRKYNELNSDVFNNGHVQGYDREIAHERVKFGTNADWKCEGGYSKPQNG